MQGGDGRRMQGPLFEIPTVAGHQTALTELEVEPKAVGLVNSWILSLRVKDLTRLRPGLLKCLQYMLHKTACLDTALVFRSSWTQLLIEQQASARPLMSNHMDLRTLMVHMLSSMARLRLGPISHGMIDVALGMRPTGSDCMTCDHLLLQ